MVRRNFIKQISVIGLGGFSCGASLLANPSLYKDLIIGHNTHRYKVDMSWGALDSKSYPVNDCHEMVQDSKGRIVLLTNHTQNNVIIYDKQGQLDEVWGTKFPGAHGLTLKVEGDKDFLYISDNERHEVIKTTIDGKIVNTFTCPIGSGLYESKDQFVPTETAVADNGDIYIADGYGEQHILHYSFEGRLLNVFGGRGDDELNFDNAHGIAIDNRNQQHTLLITDRMTNKLKRFSMSGDYIETINLPGAYICRPVIHDQYVYLATIWSGNGANGTGFVSILNKDNKLISSPGGCEPMYKEGQLQHMYQAIKLFTHPHDVCVDEDENLYVAQWNSGKSYPIKLIRI